MVKQFTLREKGPYSEFLWSVFSRIRTEYGPENFKYGHFSVEIKSTDSFLLDREITLNGLITVKPKVFLVSVWHLLTL